MGVPGDVGQTAMRVPAAVPSKMIETVLPSATAALVLDAHVGIEWNKFTRCYVLGRSLPSIAESRGPLPVLSMWVRPDTCPMTFTVEGSDAPVGPARVALSGDLDAGTVDQARSALLEPSATVVIADLADLTFCDSSGLAVLLRVRMILEEEGRSLVLANPPRHFLTLAQIAGVGNPFSIAE